MGIFSFINDKLKGIGLGLDLFGASMARMPGGEFLTFMQIATVTAFNRNPIRLLEFKIVLGTHNVWHVVVGPFMIGKSMARNVNQVTGELLGADFGHYFFMLHCLNRITSFGEAAKTIYPRKTIAAMQEPVDVSEAPDVTDDDTIDLVEEVEEK